MGSVYSELMLSLIFASLMLTALIVIQLRKDVRELRELLQRQLPPEAEGIEHTVDVTN
jgi:hypothetical protein